MRLFAAVAAVVALGAAFPASALEFAFESDSTLPIVELNVAFRAGSVDDPKGASGLTNFMGEMLLRGTKSRNKEQIDVALDQMGASLEVETRAEFMVLRGSVLSSQLDGFLRLVGELITQSAFPDTELRKLRDLIVSGIHDEMGQDQTLESRKYNSFLFHGNAYGNPVLGNERDVKRITRARVIDQYERVVRSSRIVVVGSGDASSAQIESWARMVSGERPDGPQSSEKLPALEAPTQATERRLELVDKPDRTQTQVNIGQIGVRFTEPNYFPLYLGNYAFGGGSFESRLMQEIRVKRGWSYGAGSYFMAGTQPRSWTIHFFPAAKDTPEAVALALKMVGDLKANGITQKEFDFSKRSLIESDGFRYNTPKKRIENRLFEIVLNLPDGFMRSYGRRLEPITLAQVNDALRDFLKPEGLTVSVLGTDHPSSEAKAKGAPEDLASKLAISTEVPRKRVKVVPYTED